MVQQGIGGTSRGAAGVLAGSSGKQIPIGSMPGYKVWTNPTGGTSDGWVEEKFKHPFTSKNLPMTGGDWGAWTSGSVSTHGVVWGLAYNGRESKSVLWKPPLPTIKDKKTETNQQSFTTEITETWFQKRQ
jgi:hypothetical protein